MRIGPGLDEFPLKYPQKHEGTWGLKPVQSLDFHTLVCWPPAFTVSLFEVWKERQSISQGV